MAVNYEEGTLNGKLVFVIDAENEKEALNFLDSNVIAVGTTTRNVILIHPAENATEEQIQNIRDALSENI